MVIFFAEKACVSAAVMILFPRPQRDAPRRKSRGISSVGRAPQWHWGGQRFEPAMLHQIKALKHERFKAFSVLSTALKVWRSVFGGRKRSGTKDIISTFVVWGDNLVPLLVWTYDIKEIKNRFETLILFCCPLLIGAELVNQCLSVLVCLRRNC